MASANVAVKFVCLTGKIGRKDIYLPEVMIGGVIFRPKEVAQTLNKNL